MIDLYEETNIDVLRHQLASCEDSILRQSKYDGLLICPDDKEELCDFLENRCGILNRMFQLHAKDAEIHRFECVNEHLFNLTQEFNKWHLHLQEKMSSIHGLNGTPFQLETTLDFYLDSDNPQLYVMDEDDFYGSRWKEMLDINCIALENTYTSAASCSGENTCDMDDGVSWKEGWLNYSKFDHICICYLAHRLCCHMRYSIPDLLRMTTYYYNYELNTPSDKIIDAI